MREPIESYYVENLMRYTKTEIEFCDAEEVRALEKDYADLEQKFKIAEEALEIARDHMQKAVDEVEGCPFENCIQHDDGSTSCRYEDCIHYKASEIITEALSAIREE